MRISLARTLSRSAANGPGERFVVWVQGCPLACPGCWNPDTWDFSRHDVREVSTLVAEILATPGIKGVTFTGGEPFMQASSLAEVARSVRRAGLSVFVFTGHDLAELTGDAHGALLAETDVLVAGRFVESKLVQDVPWIGSSNQRVHFLTDRYAPTDMERSPVAEFHLNPDGSTFVTGFPPAGVLSRQLETDDRPPADAAVESAPRRSRMLQKTRFENQ